MSNNSPQLQKRFSQEGLVTDLFLTDPDGLFLPALAKKTKVTPAELRDKLRQTVSIVTDAYTKSKQCGQLRIYAMSNYPTHATFCSKDKLIITPYQLSSGRRVVPLYVYVSSENADSRVLDAVEDIDRLRGESKLTYDSSELNTDATAQSAGEVPTSGQA